MSFPRLLPAQAQAQADHTHARAMPNSVDSGALQDGAVTRAKLLSSNFSSVAAAAANTSYTATVTSYGTAVVTGSYGVPGVAFTAATSGKVLILYSAAMFNSGANQSYLAPVVRQGSTVGSGTVQSAASDLEAIVVTGTDLIRTSSFKVLEGLTAGSVYNVQLEHRVSAGTGTFDDRYVVVLPILF